MRVGGVTFKVLFHYSSNIVNKYLLVDFIVWAFSLNKTSIVHMFIDTIIAIHQLGLGAGREVYALICLMIAVDSKDILKQVLRLRTLTVPI